MFFNSKINIKPLTIKEKILCCGTIGELVNLQIHLVGMISPETLKQFYHLPIREINFDNNPYYYNNRLFVYTDEQGFVFTLNMNFDEPYVEITKDKLSFKEFVIEEKGRLCF